MGKPSRLTFIASANELITCYLKRHLYVGGAGAKEWVFLRWFPMYYNANYMDKTVLYLL